MKKKKRKIKKSKNYQKNKEIKDRVNLTKNAFHKLGIEGQVNINVMLNDIDGGIAKKYEYQDKIKAKIEVKDEIYDAKIVLQSLLEEE